MQVYRFRVLLSRPFEDEDYDRLFDLGLGDCTLGTELGTGFVLASREAEDYDSAVLSVTKALGDAGFSITAVSRDEPETAA